MNDRNTHPKAKWPAPALAAGWILLLSSMVCTGASAEADALASQPSANQTSTTQAAETRSAENTSCLRCHQMETLAYRDPENGEIVDLSIAPEALSHSVHGALACSDCHDSDFGQYPHPERLKGETLSCVGCHEEHDDTTERLYRFKTIDAEFERSIHATSDNPKIADFSCHSCHDPHAFRNSAVGEDIAQIVQADNAICLSCHTKLLDPLRDPHTWLPKREKHRESVRCIDCHTPLSKDGQTVSHQILAGKDSNRDCVNCHSKKPQLLNRLYQYRSETDLASQGWVSKAVFNEAYVVGMSRSPLIDRLALAIIGITLLVLGAHSYGRYRAYRRSKEDHR